MSGLVETLLRARLVPVVRHADPQVALAASRILADEGARALEITMTVPGADRLIAGLKAEFPGIAVGAGTVLTGDEADRVIAAGAGFVVSPCWVASVADRCRAAGVPYLPGAMTPGEVHHHHAAGALVVKVFPADAAGGPGFLKALRAVFPAIPLMPTGGVTTANAAAYLDAGALCVGMGGNLVPAGALEAGDTAAARRDIRAALDAVLKT